MTKDEARRILHVDDEDDIRVVVKTILEKEGFEVMGVSSAKKALEVIETNDFALLLLDVMMPDMSGWELFTKIGQINPDYDVIFLTVLEATPERLTQLKEHGIRDYITKPFDRGDFVARVNKAILG